jgi:hypothetical protein
LDFAKYSRRKIYIFWDITLFNPLKVNRLFGETFSLNDVGGWTILKWTLGWDGMDWMDLAQDREQ